MMTERTAFGPPAGSGGSESDSAMPGALGAPRPPGSKAVDAKPAPPPRPLLLQRGFGSLWWGQLISILGERPTSAR